ncbi:MAG: DUF2780 domain-containing protein [Aestuariibacter sp.]
MRKLLLIVGLTMISAQTYAQESWLDTLKSMLGLGEETVTQNENLSLNGLTKQVAEKLGVTEQQATGGLAALMNYAKNAADSEQFQSITQSLPGMDALLAAVPKVSTPTGQIGGLDSLLSKAAEYSETLKGLNDLKMQFEAIGLDPQIIPQYIAQINEYLDTPEGQQAKTLLMDTFSRLTI